jgi:hypothetical protein
MFIQMVKISVLAEGSIVIPVWVISIVIGFLASLLTTWGILQATKANLEVRAKRNEEDIQSIQKEKVNKSEFEIVYKMLQKIDNKLDEHINQS